MKKIVVFVEGNTELIFVREYLRKSFEFQDIEIECRKRQYGRFDEVPFSMPNPNAKYHFRIINVGGDKNVLDDIIEDEIKLRNIGYEKIIGLRDMFSEEYKKKVKQPMRIDNDEIQKFIMSANKRIERDTKFPQNIKLHFAIMEIEAWFLGISNLWQRKGLSSQAIKEKIKVDLSTIDPETTFVHPTEIIKSILKTINESYDKHAGQVESLVGKITKQDFEDLQNSQKCNSFKKFALNLMNN
jgi:Domain of unknown function (DUF4276)